MADIMDRLQEFRKEGSAKFAVMRATGNAVRNFADAKRENSADGAEIRRLQDEVARLTAENHRLKAMISGARASLSVGVELRDLAVSFDAESLGPHGGGGGVTREVQR